jgi:hypothetical protein
MTSKGKMILATEWQRNRDGEVKRSRISPIARGYPVFLVIQIMLPRYDLIFSLKLVYSQDFILHENRMTKEREFIW